MSESTTVPAAPAATSFWDDAIEIFVHPAEVYRRRRNSSPWAPFLFVGVMVGVLTFATFNTLSPVFEAEFTRNAARQMTSGSTPPSPEAMNKARDIGLNVARYGSGVFIMVAMLLVGIGTWIVAKIVGAATTFTQALMIAAWAYFPRILGAVAAGVQGLLTDVSQLKSVQGISLSPARFLDPDATNPLVFQLLGRLDLTVLWETVLLAIGVYVTGKITKNQAVLFAVLIWLIGSLQALRTGYMAM